MDSTDQPNPIPNQMPLINPTDQPNPVPVPNPNEKKYKKIDRWDRCDSNTTIRCITKKCGIYCISLYFLLLYFTFYNL